MHCNQQVLPPDQLPKAFVMYNRRASDLFNDGYCSLECTVQNTLTETGFEPAKLKASELETDPFDQTWVLCRFLPIPPPREISIRLTICYRTIVTFTAFKNSLE